MPFQPSLRRFARPALAAAYLAVCAAFLIGIGRGELVPYRGNDSCPYLIMAAQPWTSPAFWHGPRPPTVPWFWSFFSGGRDEVGIILFQVAFQAAAWIAFAWSAAAGLRNRILGDLLIAALLAYSLLPAIHQDGTRLLSESISLSLMLLTAALLLHCLRAPTAWRALAVAPAAIPFAFARDTNAYLLMGTALALAAWSARRWFRAPRPPPSYPLLGLAYGFAILLILSNTTAFSIAQPEGDFCYGADHPIVRHRLADKQGPRYLFPLLNVFALRILPYDCRLAWFEKRGMPTGDAVRAKAFQWAFQEDWEWYWRDSLQPTRAWLQGRGKRYYAGYLSGHPGYTFIRPWRELAPVYLGFPFGRATPFLVAGVAALCLGLRLRRGGGDAAPAACLAALGVCAWAALFIYHADAMDLERHSRANIVLLDLILALAAFTLADRFKRDGAPPDAPSVPSAP